MLRVERSKGVIFVAAIALIVAVAQVVEDHVEQAAAASSAAASTSLATARCSLATLGVGIGVDVGASLETRCSLSLATCEPRASSSTLHLRGRWLVGFVFLINVRDARFEVFAPLSFIDERPPLAVVAARTSGALIFGFMLVFERKQRTREVVRLALLLQLLAALKVLQLELLALLAFDQVVLLHDRSQVGSLVRLRVQLLDRLKGTAHLALELGVFAPLRALEQRAFGATKHNVLRHRVGLKISRE